MDESSEMTPHIDSTLNDVQEAIREVPVYHVTHDDPHQTLTHAPRPRHEVYPELLRKYEEERSR